MHKGWTRMRLAGSQEMVSRSGVGRVGAAAYQSAAGVGQLTHVWVSQAAMDPLAPVQLSPRVASCSASSRSSAAPYVRSVIGAFLPRGTGNFSMGHC